MTRIENDNHASDAGLTPTQIRRRVTLAGIDLTHGVEFELSVWSGRERWADLAPELKRRHGEQALVALDKVLAELTAAREQLAAALSAEESNAGE